MCVCVCGGTSVRAAISVYTAGTLFNKGHTHFTTAPPPLLFLHWLPVQLSLVNCDVRVQSL